MICSPQNAQTRCSLQQSAENANHVKIPDVLDSSPVVRLRKVNKHVNNGWLKASEERIQYLSFNVGHVPSTLAEASALSAIGRHAKGSYHPVSGWTPRNLKINHLISQLDLRKKGLFV